MASTINDAQAVAHQFHAGELCDAFRPHDLARLATLSATQRAAQAQARQLLAAYVDALWDDLKAQGLRPADRPDLYGAVAAMRDLTHALHTGHTVRAQIDAGDDLS